jgi:hypothetical protein
MEQQKKQNSKNEQENRVRNELKKRFPHPYKPLDMEE